MEPTLWTEWATTSTVRQLWFPGAHADVGGGYSDGRLANAPLRWMRTEAAGFGLNVREPLRSEEQRVLHQERTGGRVIGFWISKIKGEQPRKGLVAPSSGSASSMDFDQTACDNLLSQIEDI